VGVSVELLLVARVGVLLVAGAPAAALLSVVLWLVVGVLVVLLLVARVGVLLVAGEPTAALLPGGMRPVAGVLDVLLPVAPPPGARTAAAESVRRCPPEASRLEPELSAARSSVPACGATG
jgi:hypothetical protein